MIFDEFVHGTYTRVCTLPLAAASERWRSVSSIDNSVVVVDQC